MDNKKEIEVKNISKNFGKQKVLNRDCWKKWIRKNSIVKMYMRFDEG